VESRQGKPRRRIATLTYGREYHTDGASYPARAVQAPVIIGRGFLLQNYYGVSRQSAA